MSEIRTCEQYVLERLETLEVDNESLKKLVTLKDSAISNLTNELTELKDFIRRNSTLNTNSDGNRYIDFSNPWEIYDADDFKYILNILKEGN